MSDDARDDEMTERRAGMARLLRDLADTIERGGCLGYVLGVVNPDHTLWQSNGCSMRVPPLERQILVTAAAYALSCAWENVMEGGAVPQPTDARDRVQ